MKAYLITMFILWIMRTALIPFTSAIKENREFYPIANFLRWCMALGFSIWTGILLFT